MSLELITEILGWTSILFYLSITCFNSMKITRYAAFASTGNDIIWSFLMGWYPKLVLNVAVTSVNLFKYFKDFTKTPKSILYSLASFMGLGIAYLIYFSIISFIANPTIFTILQFVDLAFVLLAMGMTSLKNYRISMFISGFIGFAAYYGNIQMMIIKILVIGIMSYKFITEKEE